jgi:hypothetical protein
MTNTETSIKKHLEPYQRKGKWWIWHPANECNVCTGAETLEKAYEVAAERLAFSVMMYKTDRDDLRDKLSKFEKVCIDVFGYEDE